MQDILVQLKTGEGGRLDQCLSAHSGVSRRRVRKAIDEGGVYINRKRCRTAGRALRGGELLRMVTLENEQLTPFAGEQLLWQQDDLYLIHKRSGQYAQAALHRSRGTLPDELARFLELPTTASISPVHRLDRGTSGLMLLTSSATCLQHMQARWAQDVKKSYLGVIATVPTWQDQRVSSAISRRRDALGRYHIDPAGRACDSEFHVQATAAKRSLLQLMPHTGRSHQLRVHLASLGCPLLGDTRYGGATASRLMLHAHRLAFPLPHSNHIQEWEVAPEDDWSWP
ncbi:MAG: RluA family pseudouridine synthase [Mariprofundaceae bacterium]|nr:RluA family pseudouridine synthase [Mariprofundaceae bacterium]